MRDWFAWATGKSLCDVTQVSVGGIKRQGFRVVEDRGDAGIGKMFLQGIALFRANNVKMINMVAIGRDFRRD